MTVSLLDHVPFWIIYRQSPSFIEGTIEITMCDIRKDCVHFFPLLKEFALKYLLLISSPPPQIQVALLYLCLHIVSMYVDSEFFPK